MNINLTLIGQTIAFAIFVLFCMKYVWPPINQVMQERKKKLRKVWMRQGVLSANCKKSNSK